MEESTVCWDLLVTKLLVRLQGAFELLAQQNPKATSRMLEGMARRIAAASSARGRRSFFHHLNAPLHDNAHLNAHL